MKKGKLFSGFAFVLDREIVQDDKLLRMVSLMEIKLDSAILKLSTLPLEHLKQKNPNLRNNPAYVPRHYNLSEINAPVELPSDQDDDWGDSSDRSAQQIKKRYQKILVNIDSRQEEKGFTHEVILQFLKAKKTPIQEEKLVFFTESKEWSTFWRNTIQGLHDSNRKFTYTNNIKRDLKLLKANANANANAEKDTHSMSHPF